MEPISATPAELKQLWPQLSYQDPTRYPCLVVITEHGKGTGNIDTAYYVAAPAQPSRRSPAWFWSRRDQCWKKSSSILDVELERRQHRRHSAEVYAAAAS